MVLLDRFHITNMFHYILFTLILTTLLLAYFRIARHYNIIDKPNHRSSHRTITIRGGGIIFPIAALLWFFYYGFNFPWAITGLGIMAVVSFLDDIKTLSSKIRTVAHIIAVSFLFWQVQLFNLPWYYIPIAYLFTIAWINAFNFMDGINGITAFYSLVALFTLFWLNNTIAFIAPELLIILIISVLVFSFFNVRKRALTFAGDLGSVSMAFILAWFIISLMIKTGRIEYILLFAVYGIDTVVTIIYRLKRRENIFEAHRSHLYQYMSNELNLPHVWVSVVYGFVQLIINVITLWLFYKELMNYYVFCGILIVLTLFYLIVRFRIRKRIVRQ